MPVKFLICNTPEVIASGVRNTYSHFLHLFVNQCVYCSIFSFTKINSMLLEMDPVNAMTSVKM